MPAAQRSETAAGAAGLLVCVYYRVARGQADEAAARVREIQRGLLHGRPDIQAEVLVRCDPPSPPPSDVPRTAAEHETLMETYRLPLPARAGSPAAEAAVREFLQALDAAARPLACLWSGPRHLELFVPCAS